MKNVLAVALLFFFFSMTSLEAQQHRSLTAVEVESLGPVSDDDVRGRVASAIARTLNLQASTEDVTVLGCNDYAANLFCNSNLNASISGTDCYLPESQVYVEFNRLDAQAGQTVTLRVTTTTAYTLLVAIQDWTTGTVLRSNFGKSSVTLAYALPANGPYVVTVGFLEKFATGSYTMNVACSTSSAPPTGGCQPVATLTCPLTNAMVGSLASSDCTLSQSFYADLYRVTGVKNQPIEVTVTAEFPVYIAGDLAAGGEGTWVQGDRTMTLSYTPSADGTVNIWVSSEGEKVTGGYTISAKCPGPAPCRSRAVRK